MRKNPGYHYRDFTCFMHISVIKDSGEDGLERRENRPIYRFTDAVREEKGHTQMKRQNVKKENEWNQ